MPKLRDDFTETTIRILGQRVGYKCSNLDCRRPTVGPHTENNKATIVGIAAHITAASPGGARYDPLLTKEERKNINNGIWLCSNCGTLIDKDPVRFPTHLLEHWKEESEKMAWDEIVHYTPHPKIPVTPLLVMDLIWSGGGKYNRGINFEKTMELYSGPIHPNQTIYYNELFWRFNFSIYNNSSYPAFNIQVSPLPGNNYFTYIDKLPRVNNIAPLANIDLEAKFTKNFNGTGTEALKIIDDNFPLELEGQQLQISYQDESQRVHKVIVTLSKNGLTNNHLLPS